MAGDRNRVWRVLATERLFEGPPWVAVDRQRIQLPDGGVIEDFYRVVLPDFVQVVAVTDEGRLVMVRGYRHGPERVSLGPPGGMVEPGELPLEAARRELVEETGYASEAWSPLGRYVVDGNRRCGIVHMFLARAASRVGVPVKDASEDLDVLLMEPAQVEELLPTGEVGSLAGAGCIALALLALGRPARS